jgi:hypothetical protein
MTKGMVTLLVLILQANQDVHVAQEIKQIREESRTILELNANLCKKLKAIKEDMAIDKILVQLQKERFLALDKDA